MWDISEMITHFQFFNSRISSGIPGASLEFEDFISLKSAKVIRGIEVIYTFLIKYTLLMSMNRNQWGPMNFWSR
jgi:hypothetical protein